MSFLRHEEIYQSDVMVLGSGGAGRPFAPHLIVSMSFRLAIPWTVALQQSRPPLRQPGSSIRQKQGAGNDFPANGNKCHYYLSQA